LAKSLIYAIQRNQPAQVPEKVDNSADAADAADAADVESVAETVEAVLEPSVETQQSADSEVRWVVTPCEERLVRTAVLEQIRSSLMDLLRRPDCDEAYVDLSQVEYIGNAAIGMLLSVHQRSAAANTRLVLSGMKPQVHEQLSSRRFDKVFNIQRP
jgi:anti-anti-sigma factor